MNFVCCLDHAHLQVAIKVGAHQLEVCKGMMSTPMVVDHANNLKAKLLAVDAALSCGRRVVMFDDLDPDWQADPEAKVEEFGQHITAAELTTKLCKALMASLPKSKPSG